MKPRTLLAQVLAVNLLLVTTTVLVLVVSVDSSVRGRETVVFGLALTATLLANWLLLRRRFHPLDELISTMERIDLAAPSSLPEDPRGPGSADVRRLHAAFRRMVGRLESERRAAGRAAIQAQERERRRIAQDLHDEVNQALSAVSLRLQASIEHAPPDLREELIETKQLSRQAMEELLGIARQLRPAVLDDHGLIAALDSQVRLFGEQCGVAASLSVELDEVELSDEQQLVIYRITQESLSNVAQHANATVVTVSLSVDEMVRLIVRDDGRGFRRPRHGGLGLSGMRERALLVGGELAVRSRPGEGTEVMLALPLPGSASPEPAA